MLMSSDVNNVLNHILSFYTVFNIMKFMNTEVKEKIQPLNRNSIPSEGKITTKKFDLKSACIHVLKDLSLSQSVLVICRILSIKAQLGIYVFRCVDDTGFFDAKFISSTFLQEPEWMKELK